MSKLHGSFANIKTTCVHKGFFKTTYDLLLNLEIGTLGGALLVHTFVFVSFFFFSGLNPLSQREFNVCWKQSLKNFKDCFYVSS